MRELFSFLPWINILLLFFIIIKIKKIMSNTDQALTQLSALADQLAKVKTEVQNLKDAAANAADTPQSVLDAIGKVHDAVQAVDDINPDAAATDTSSTPTT